VLVFTALDGLTVREAATLLGRSESATESLLHRARVAFRLAYGMEERSDG
jgi:DNA-directed RNA polymerase specialized sigma24 family protein